MHKAKLIDTKTCEVTECKLRNFILDSYDEMWYLELKHATKFYSAVKPKKILDHLQGECLGRHAVDVLQLLDMMRTCHVDAAGINEYINLLEDGQRQAKRIDEANPITNATVLTIATGAMLKTQQFPRANDEYEALARSSKTWTAWKEVYKKAQGAERVQVAITGGGTGFGGAAPADPTPSSKPAPTRSSTLPANQNVDAVTLADIEACFDNMAASAKVQSETFDSLVKSNASLAKSVQALTEANKKLTAQLAETNKNRSKGKPADGAKPCRHCKNKNMGSTSKKQPKHLDKECWELPYNASKRPTDWASCL